jgi:hypothetical protein
MAATIRAKLTPKQVKFVTNYVKTGNATQAALESYNCSSDNTARSMGCQTLANVNVERKIAEICQRRGLTEDWAVKILKRQGKATRPVVAGKEIVEYPDNPSRIEAAQTALKLHGHLRAGVNVQDNSQHLTVGVTSADDVAKLAGIVAELKALRGSSVVGQQSGEIIDIDKYRVD